ncbi:MAG: type II CRISPR RNA-guided endonuclease Cas9 [Bacteroidetes bacterium]|jgi:CRISPR-associated endonuclease Csn1|nr:type II CRISPR RNA-guided endonuclease Cas9 [Bacteroidota bacterium]
MGKILGLDLGTNSIGWAVVKAKFDNNGKVEKYEQIEDTGVRIFPEGVKKETIGKGDLEESKNAARREHRQSRKQQYRKKLRKYKLLQILISLDMCPLTLEELKKWMKWNKNEKTEGRQYPQSSEFIEWLKLNPYELRAKGVEADLTKPEFGRILYHLIQRRGFLSSRKGSDEGAIYKGKENVKGIESTKQHLNGKTLGQYLNSLYPKEGESYKTQKERIRARYTLRDMYIHEFETIYNRQREHLKLDQINIPFSKKRYLTGGKDRKRNQKKMEYLIKTKGVENVSINEIKHGNRTVTEIITREIQPFKQFIAGDITNENGQLKYKSNESLLFWQRPLKSQKSLLAKCRFESSVFKQNGKSRTIGKTPCPLSHPEFELFRSYQFINTIQFGKRGRLDEFQQKKVMDLMDTKKGNFGFSDIPKTLHLTFERFNYADDQKIAGNTTISQLKPLFPDTIWEQHYEQIWHCFYFYEDNEMLFTKLTKDFQLNTKRVPNPEKLKDIQLKEGYSNVSLKAIRNILPFLKKGYGYNIAVILGGVKNAFGDKWEYFQSFHDELEKDITAIIFEPNKEGELIEKIKDYLSTRAFDYGFERNDKRFKKLYHHSQEVEQKTIKEQLDPVENLRNPIVQQGINELRRIVNSLNKEYGPFDQIKVEMGRDLRNNKNRRQEISYNIRRNEEKNEKAREILREYGLQPTRENMHKYLLYEEISNRANVVMCPYTGNTINISDVLGSINSYQVEHIIPYSVSLNDSFDNKTLCESNFNRKKGELTPYEFYQKNPNTEIWNAASWEQIEERAFRLLPYQKAKRFISRRKPDVNDFIERQLNDSRYISKKAKEILSQICKDVRLMPGALTSELRHLWGLNNVLQPVRILQFDGYDVHENKRLAHYLVYDEDDNPVEIKPVMNNKPAADKNESVITGYIHKGVFESSLLKIKVDTPDLEDGKYWALIGTQSHQIPLKVFAEKPDTEQDRIVLKVKVNKGDFYHENIGRKLPAKLEDGSYWSVFKITGKDFIKPSKDKPPKKTTRQLMLYGTVKGGIFKSYIYQCETEFPEGNYWLILDIDLDNIEFVSAKNKPPEASENELVLTGSVNENNNFTADNDPDFNLAINTEPDKYYLKLEITRKPHGFVNIYNKPPDLKKGQRLVEGITWVDKQTGEIKFDPKKNRDDHRHHAIDAITIAVTDQAFLQKLSTANAKKKEKERGVSHEITFPEPWAGFRRDVEQVAEKILVSYKQQKQVLTTFSKSVYKEGRKFVSKGKIARGRLHREFYFGKHARPLINENGKMIHKDNKIVLETDSQNTEKPYYHIRKSIATIKNNKHVEKIVDEHIKKLIKDRLVSEYTININKNYTIPDDFFYKKNENGEKELNFFLPNKHGNPVPVKKVRMRENVGNAVHLKSNINQWVNPYNNHHIVIYKDENGVLQEEVVSFWTAVERMYQKQPLYQLPSDGKEFIATLQENDMFLLGLNKEDIQTLKWDKTEYELISKHLYRVQKISSMDYTFRHHLSSKIDDKETSVRLSSFSSWENMNPVKVFNNNIGKIKG